jgi:hypothetical protein
MMSDLEDIPLGSSSSFETWSIVSASVLSTLQLSMPWDRSALKWLIGTYSSLGFAKQVVLDPGSLSVLDRLD